jgi:Icc protein
MSSRQPLLSFSVCSDLHFMAWKETEAAVAWVPVLEAALADIAALQPRFMVVNGDLTNGKARDYRLAMEALASVRRSMPVYFTMGNHEYYGLWEQTDYPGGQFSLAAAQRRFLDFTGMEAIYYEKQWAGFPFLFLSTERYDPDMKDAGWLSPQQLDWLRQRLLQYPSGPLFAFFHQPVNGTVADSADTCLQSEEIRSLLARRPGVLWFSGHTHCRMDRPDQLAAEEMTLYVGGGCLHNETSQSRWVDVYPDRIVLRIRDHINRQWLDDFEFSMSL